MIEHFFIRLLAICIIAFIFKVPSEKNLNPIFIYLKSLTHVEYFHVTDSKAIC